MPATRQVVLPATLVADTQHEEDDMNEATVTVTGWVATDVTLFPAGKLPAMARFRVASTPRRFKDDRWVDGETLFATVQCRNALADNAGACVHKGQPILVTGRVRLERWRTEERTGEELVIEARSVGHDLSWGTADFVRTLRRRRDSATSDDAPWIRGTDGASASPVAGSTAGNSTVGVGVSGALPTQPKGGGQDPWATESGEPSDTDERAA